MYSTREIKAICEWYYQCCRARGVRFDTPHKLSVSSSGRANAGISEARTVGKLNWVHRSIYSLDVRCSSALAAFYHGRSDASMAEHIAAHGNLAPVMALLASIDRWTAAVQEAGRQTMGHNADYKLLCLTAEGIMDTAHRELEGALWRSDGAIMSCRLLGVVPRWATVDGGQG